MLWARRDQEPRATRSALRDAFVSLAAAGGREWLRSVPANPAADPRRVVQAVLASPAP